MSECKNYRKIIKNMNKEQLQNQYNKARKRILSFDNSLEMLDALDQFEFSIMFFKE